MHCKYLQSIYCGYWIRMKCIRNSSLQQMMDASVINNWKSSVTDNIFVPSLFTYTFKTIELIAVCFFKKTAPSCEAYDHPSTKWEVVYNIYIVGVPHWSSNQHLWLDHEVAGSIPRTSTILKCGLNQEWAPPSLVRRIG